MSISWDEARMILKLLRESELAELSVEIGGLRLYARKDAVASATPVYEPPSHEAAPQSAAPAPIEPVEQVFDERYVVIRAPMVGVFYRAPSPNAEPFAKEGDIINAGETLFLIEVMKLFNSVSAGVRGRVVRFLADNATLVQHNQPVALIEPTD